MQIFTPLNFFKRNIKGFECKCFMRHSASQNNRKGIRVETCVHMVLCKVSFLVYILYMQTTVRQSFIKTGLKKNQYNNTLVQFKWSETLMNYSTFGLIFYLLIDFFFRWSTQASRSSHPTQRTATWCRTVWRRGSTRERLQPRASRSSSSPRIARKSCSRK